MGDEKEEPYVKVDTEKGRPEAIVLLVTDSDRGRQIVINVRRLDGRVGLDLRYEDRQGSDQVFVPFEALRRLAAG